MNAIKTAALLGLMSALLLLAGQAIGGRQGLIVGLMFAVAMNFVSYFFSEKIALSMYSAQPVTPTENAHIYRRVGPMVQNLTHKMGIPMPKLWVIPEQSPNAFATGRNPRHSSVAFTAGVLDLMDDRELEGVIAHELGHIRNRDILTSSIAATLAAALTSMAQMAFFFGGSRHHDDEDSGGSAAGGLFMLLVAPIAASLIQMAISRTREFSADATAARFTGSPHGLISALAKLEGWSKRLPMEASPATAHMFIIPPASLGWLANLFSTHPRTEERIARLQNLG